MMGTPVGLAPSVLTKPSAVIVSSSQMRKHPHRGASSSPDSAPTVLPWDWVWSTKYQEAGGFSSFWKMKVERRVPGKAGESPGTCSVSKYLP